MIQTNVTESLWTKKFSLLFVGTIFMYISTFMFTPTLPLFAKSIGVNNASIGGFIILCYTLGSFAPRIFWGNLADNFGRIPVFLLGIFIITVATPFFGIFVSLAGILVIRMIQGIGFSASSVSGSTMAVDFIPPSRMSEGIGIYSLANTIGMALGPNLGLVIMQSLGFGWLNVVSLFLGTLSLSIGVFLKREVRHKRNPLVSSYPKNSNQTSLTSARVTQGCFNNGEKIEKNVLIIGIVALFAVIPYGAIMGYIAEYGINQDVENIGLYFSVYASALFLVRMVAGRLLSLCNVTMLVILGNILMVGGLTLLFWADKLAIFMISAILFGFGFGLVWPFLQAVTISLCSRNHRGRATAILFTASDLAYGLGAVCVGVGIKYFGYAVAFAGLSIFVIFSAIFFLLLIHPQLKNEKE
ncbi:MFS transporter [Enterococcus innesii]|uniref:MFS transporter n=1 Tax=Enterococcus innesii TaxID=2839759 RepID=UPI0034A1D915